MTTYTEMVAAYRAAKNHTKGTWTCSYPYQRLQQLAPSIDNEGIYASSDALEFLRLAMDGFSQYTSTVIQGFFKWIHDQGLVDGDVNELNFLPDRSAERRFLNYDHSMDEVAAAINNADNTVAQAIGCLAHTLGFSYADMSRITGFKDRTLYLKKRAPMVVSEEEAERLTPLFVEGGPIDSMLSYCDQGDASLDGQALARHWNVDEFSIMTIAMIWRVNYLREHGMNGFQHVKERQMLSKDYDLMTRLKEWKADGVISEETYQLCTRN